MTRWMTLLVMAGVLTMAAAERKVLVHGHRGARAVLPENTIPAFQFAKQAGADYLELDLAVTKDNVLVVSHDPILNGTICQGPYVGKLIRTLTLAQVKEMDCGRLRNPDFAKQKPVPGARIPTFDEVLALNAPLNVEIKSFPQHPEYTPSPEEFARMVLDTLRKHKAEKRMIVQSFDFRPLHAMKKLAPEIRMAALYSGPARDFVEIAREAGTLIVAPNYKLVTKEQVEKAHAAGLQVVPWTVNTAPEWQAMIDAGVDAIITDDPAELISYLTQARP